MTPKHHPIEKKKHLPSTSIFGFQPLIFQDCCFFLDWLVSLHQGFSQGETFSQNSQAKDAEFMFPLDWQEHLGGKARKNDGNMWQLSMVSKIWDDDILQVVFFFLGFMESNAS